jgi:uncharacterized membrane protein
MTRKEFLDQLDYLLSDLPESERLEAMAYYESYFEEAGPDAEEEVIRTLVSPQIVAAQIKGNLKRESESYGEYTENGYQDRRMPEHAQVPQTYRSSRRKNLIIMIIIGMVFLSPFIKDLFGGVARIFVTILLLPFLLAFALGVATIGMLIGGIACVAVGIRMCFLTPAAGILTIGIGSILAAVGIVAFLLLLYLGTTWLPKIVHGVLSSLVRRVFCRKDGARS